MKLLFDKNNTIIAGYKHLKFVEQLAKNMNITLDLLESRVNKKDLANNLWNDVLGKDTLPLNTPILKKEFFIGQVFLGHKEINDTLQLIDAIPFMFKRFPGNIQFIGKQLYFRYHITSYYNLIFILLERTAKFQKWLIRKYRKNKDYEELIKEMEKLIPQGLLVRKSHRNEIIHKQYFADLDISRASLYELLRIIPPDDKRTELMYSWLERKNTKKIRKKWLADFEETNLETLKYMDLYCEKLYPIIFSDDGSFIFPNNIDALSIKNLSYSSSRE